MSFDAAPLGSFDWAVLGWVVIALALALAAVLDPLLRSFFD